MSPEKKLLINLIQKHQQDALSEQEKTLLTEMINSNGQYADFFKNSTQAALPQSNVDDSYTKIRDLLTKENSAKAKIRPIKLWKYAVAASILLCGIFGLFYYSLKNDNELAYEVPMGAQGDYILPDGTSVSLNGGSKLTVSEDFGLKNRNVTLEGEGYFDVKHDAKNPFIVTSKNLKIKVLGTAFNIRDYDDDTMLQTTLIRGKVELTYKEDSKENSYTLLPGDRITFSKNTISELETVEKSDVIISRENIKEDKLLKNNIAWKDGLLVFDNDPLPLVVSKLEKWFNINIQIKDDKLLDKHFTGSFSNSSIEEILTLLKETGGFEKVTKNGKHIVIE